MIPRPATEIHLEIDRLVLDGPALAPGELPRMLAALERELGRLLGDAAADLTAIAVDRLRAPDLSPGTGDDPDRAAALGHGLARSLARTLGARP